MIKSKRSSSRIEKRSSHTPSGGKKSTPLLHEKGSLLFGLPGVGVSTIATQWYCEKKMDLEYRHKEILVESGAKDLGTQGHDEISKDAKLISEKELKKALSGNRRVVLQETRFIGEFDGVRIIGVPDLLDLRGRRCNYVLEFKFSRRTEPFLDRYVQCQLYGWLLEQQGYIIKSLICAICVIPYAVPASERSERVALLRDFKEIDNILSMLKASMKNMRNRKLARNAPLTLEHEGCVLHAFSYDKIQAERYLHHSLEYWLGKRESMPTTNAVKCSKCEFNAASVCKSALAIPDRGIRVLHRGKQVRVIKPWSA